MLKDDERGAIAVEFALLLPLLLMLVLGIAEFGRAYNTQISLTQAAREGVRVMAISNDAAAARTAAMNAAVSVYPAVTATDITVGTCAPGRQTTLTINYTLTTLTGFAGPFSLVGRGVMLCGG
jgi:Flp pilus assembly protein TadG